jgi:sucrose phosphorylase
MPLHICIKVGESNFFNTPGTWEYLERIKQIAQKK